MSEIETIKINEVEYVRKDSISDKVTSTEGLVYCIVRTFSAGVFAGYIKSREGKEVVLINSRRLWYWSGACSLSQLAVDGTTKPNDCTFAVVVPEMTVLEAIEIIPVSNKSFKSITGVKEWRQ